jgi:putative transposase
MRNDNLFSELMEGLTEKGLEFVPQAMTQLFNAAMEIERSKFLGAERYERSEDRKGYANGFKPKTMTTRFGKITLDIPQVRNLEFYPQCIEKGERSERALKTALAQMYISGVSTRRVKEITEVLCGAEVSSTHVSNVTKLLDEELGTFRSRKLAQFVYLILDAKYEKVRVDNQVVSQCLLIATGINIEGYREILSVAVKSSEAKVNWREFLEDLKQRGMSGVKMITSDAHSGLKEAILTVYPEVKWQRCQFHFAQDAQHKAKTKAQQPEIASAIRAIFNETSIEKAQAQVTSIADRFRDKNAELATWIEENVHECLSVYMQPIEFHARIRTSNGLERVNREINRRTSIVGIFPNTDSLLRLATAVLVEIHEEWISAIQPYMNFNNHKQLLVL